MEPKTKEVVKKAGGPVGLARKLGLSRGAPSLWIKIPPEHVISVCRETGWFFTPHQVRPDIYPHPDDGMPKEQEAA
jgi:hypothetical protein